MAGSVSETCLFKIGSRIFFVSNTHSVCMVAEQNSLRHKLSHWATFTFLKRTGLRTKFCLNPCTDHKPCEQTPALFQGPAITSKAQECNSHSLSHQSHSLLFPSMSFPLPWPHLVFAGSQNDTPGEEILIRHAFNSELCFQHQPVHQPYQCMNWSQLQLAGAELSPGEF